MPLMSSSRVMEIKRGQRWISLMISLECLAVIIFLISTITSTLGADENRKNHAPEKRQDTSYLFGGWTPIKPGNPFYHGKTDLLSLGDDGLDTASTFYSSLQHKDIYSYYPRPAIKARPKPNTPVYSESLAKRGRHAQNYDRGHHIEPQLSVAAFKDIPIEHIKGLHEAFLAAQPLPLPPFNFANQRGKSEFLEIAVHPIQEIAGEVKSAAYDAFPQGRHHGPPVNLGYASVPSHNRVKPSFPRRPLKPAPIVPLAHIPSSDIVDVKNFQIVEYPVHPVPLQHVPNGKAPSNSHYNRPRHQSRLILPQGRGNSPRLPTKLEYGQQEIAYHGAAHQPRHQVHDYSSDSSFQNQGKFEYGVQEQALKLDYEQHPQVSAEFIKVSDDQIKSLLKSIQIVDKTTKDVFTYVPVSDVKSKKKSENLHILVAVPQEQILQNSVSSPNKQRPTGYESDYDHGSRANDVQSYGAPEVSDYHQETKPQRPQLSKQSHAAYQTKGHHGVAYQEERHHNQGPASNTHHQSSKYQAQNQYAEAPAAEHQSEGYQQDQEHSDGPAIVHTGRFIEVQSSPNTEDGYRREPILALELKEGQSVEEAIKALDAETLQKLGAYSKDGLEIEIVEVPDEEYSSESRKRETVVPQPKSGNSGKKRLRATVRSSKKLS